MRSVYLFCLLACLAVAPAVFSQAGPDPLTGTWVGDWGPSAMDRNQVTLELKYSGKVLTGTVNPGPNAVPLLKATFDPQTSTVHFEADATSRRGGQIHYVIDGKVDKGTMTGSWSHDNRKGDFKITKK